MSESVRGHASGNSRAEMTKEAQNRVAPYFGIEPECVKVTFENVTVLGIESFESWYVAEKHHVMENTSYGPAKCKNCDKRQYASDGDANA